MPLSAIVIVVLRLFAIQTTVQAVSMAVQTAALGTFGHSNNYSGYAIAAVLLLVAFLEWMLAPGIGRLITARHDSQLSIAGLTREDIYSVAFVFLGLYFILVSIGPSLNWLHYFLTVSTEATGHGASGQTSFYRLASSLITLIAGFITLVPANRWAKWLLKMEQRRAEPSAQQPS